MGHDRMMAVFSSTGYKVTRAQISDWLKKDDDAAFERVVNTPTRGIGDRTLEIIRSTARQQQLTLWQASLRLLEEKVLAGRAANAVRGFMDLVIHMRTDTADMLLYRMTDSVINQSGLRAMYEAEKGEKAQARIENLNELVTAAKSFEMPEELEDMGHKDSRASQR